MARHIEHEVAYYYDFHPTEEDLMGETSVHAALVHYLVEVLTWLFRGQACAVYRNLNLEDDLRSRPGLANSPASHMPEVYPFDQRNIWSERIFAWVGRLIEIEVPVDCASLPTKEPCEHLHEVVHERGMDRRFPHQVLLGGVEIVVVGYLVFNVPGHRALLL